MTNRKPGKIQNQYRKQRLNDGEPRKTHKNNIENRQRGGRGRKPEKGREEDERGQTERK